MRAVPVQVRHHGRQLREVRGVQVVEAAEAALRHLARLGHVLRGDVRLAVRAIHSLAEQQLGAVRVP